MNETQELCHQVREELIGLRSDGVGSERRRGLLLEALGIGCEACVLECLVTSANLCEAQEDIAGQQPSLDQVAGLVTDTFGLALTPSLHWGLSFPQFFAALNARSYDLALHHATQAQSLVSAIEYPDALAHTLNLGGQLAWRVGAFDHAKKCFTRSIAESSLPWSIAIAHCQLGLTLESLGDPEAALEHQQSSIDTLTDARIRVPFLFESNRCSIMIQLGHLARANEVLDSLERFSPQAAPFVLLHRATMARFSGNLREAQSLAAKSVQLFGQAGWVGSRRKAVALQGEILIELRCFEHAIKVLVDGLDREVKLEYEQTYHQLVEAHRALGQWDHVVTYQSFLRQLTDRRRLDLHLYCRAQQRPHQSQDLREKNREIDERNRQLELLRSDRESLLNVIAHELRSPLTALGLVLRSISVRSARGIEIGARVRTGAKMVRRLQGVVDQVATVGEITNGSFAIEFEPVEVGSVLHQVVDENRLAARAKLIDLRVDEDNFYVAGHRGRLEQILTNLVSNAIKFSEMESEIHLRSFADSAHGYIEVVDEGPGLTELDLERVFSRYARLSARPTGGEPSSGMGLFIAKQLSLAMGGDLLVESAGKGLGATFSVRLALSSHQKAKV